MSKYPFSSSRDKASEWGISERRITQLCTEGRISDAVKISGVWFIPNTAKKPKDNRNQNNVETKTAKEMAEKWNIQKEAVIKYCKEGRIHGAKKDKRGCWLIPANAKNPETVNGRSVKEQAAIWGISEHLVMVSCRNGEILGVKKIKGKWCIPYDAQLPTGLSGLSTQEFAEKFSITAAKAQRLCKNGKITGAQKHGRLWRIPENAQPAGISG